MVVKNNTSKTERGNLKNSLLLNTQKMETQTAQQIIKESEGLNFEENTELYLSKMAKGELKTK
jgi:hypothetical protein